MVGKLVEWYCVIMLYATRTDFITVAVEKSHRELRFLQPIIVGGFAERRHRERQHHHQSESTKCSALRYEFVEPAPPTGHVETVHKGCKAFIALAQARSAAEHAEVDPCVQPKQETL